MTIDPNVKRQQDILRSQGMCGALSPDGQRVCIQPYAEPHAHEGDGLVDAPSTLEMVGVVEAEARLRKAIRNLPSIVGDVERGHMFELLTRIVDVTVIMRNELRVFDRARDAHEADLEKCRALISMVPAYTKHGPAGNGAPGPCDATCIKCQAENLKRTFPSR